MNREQIESLNGTKPYCTETEREQQWYEAGLVEGLEVGDTEPKPNKTVSEILNNFTGTEMFIMEQKYFDDVVLWIAEKDKIEAVKLIKGFFKSGLYEAKQYLDKITENHKQC